MSFWLTLVSIQGQPVAFSFGQFTNTSGLLLHGAVAVQTNRIDLGATREFRSGAAWYPHKVSLDGGFATTFAFQIPAGTHEGFAFVIQNNAVPLLGAGGKGMGYEGIANSVAIEFDARRNSEHADLTPGHISIHSQGTYPNVSSHSASLASTAAGLTDFIDGNVHVATIHYQPGRLQVFVGNTNAPRLELRSDLSRLINLDKGQAWIGFTADGALANARILNWSFTPAQATLPVSFTSPANNAVYPFGLAVPVTVTTSGNRVEFFDGPMLLGSDATAPFQLNWTNALPGVHSLTAVAYSADGRRAVSAPTKITVAPAQQPIGINLSRGVGGANYPLSPVQAAGVVPQNQWNNVVPSVPPGIGGASSLRDGGGIVTAAGIQFQFNGPGDEPGVDTTLSPEHQMMRAYLANNALVFPQTTSFIRVTNIPFAAYDVIVYSDSDNRGFDRVSEFRMSTESIFLRDQAYATFAGHFAEARGTANLGLNTGAGNYVRFRGLTNDNFTMEVHERSFVDIPRRAVVNALQIVPAAPMSHVRPLQVVRGPYLQSGASHAMTICWRTDRPTNSVIRYGTSPDNLNQTVSNTQTATEHAMRINGLTPNTRYYYAVGAGGTNFPASREHYFVTSPTQTQPVRLWVIGDSGTADYSAASVRDAFLDYTRERKPDLMLMLGDNAYNNGSDSEYQAALFDMFAPTLGQTVLWSCMGNHETYTLDMPYFRMFHLPTNGEAGGIPSGSESYYSFDYGNIHFVCLESTIEDRSTEGRMVTWLRQDLAAHTKQWLIVYIHAPPHSKGSHSSDDLGEAEMLEVREYILPVLEEFGVDLILSGNSHGYERSFMMDRLYGTSDTFGPQNVVQGGMGRPDEAGPYVKPSLGVAPHSGTISVIAGNGGVIRPDYGFNHPVMVRALGKLGSMVIDIDGPNLDAKMIRENGTVGDYFSVRKSRPTNAAVEVSVTARASSIAESSSPAPLFDLIRSGPTNDPLKVFYRLGGVAQNGGDFARLPQSVTIPAGQNTVTIPIAPINDSLVEPAENLTLTLRGNTAPFRLVVLPDTRAYVGQNSGGTIGMLQAQSEWIATQPDVPFVLHTGDVTENNSAGEWALAQTHLQLPVPLAVAPGDHDGLAGPVNQTALFNAHFSGPAAGVLESNKLDNAYYYFSAGGIDWLVLALEYLPRDAVLAWANGVVAAHPERRVILLTHLFLDEDDSILAVAEHGRENSPAEIWEKLLRKHANVAFVLSGHTQGDGLARRVDTGDYGNKVVQITANFSQQLNGGNGYLRILEFDPAQDRLRVQTYSPYLDASKSDAENQFEVADLGLFKAWHSRYTLHAVSNTASVEIQDTDTDVTPPALASVRAVGAGNQVVLTFSEPINALNAQDISNYSVGGFVVSAAVLLPDGKTVVLTLNTPMQDGASYTVIVSGIRDRAMPPNLIATGTTARFAHRLAFLVADFEDANLPGWQIVDEGTIDAPSVWRAPAGKLDQSSSIHGPESTATENRLGTYVYWAEPDAPLWNNYILRATIRTPDDDAVGILFWFQDSANYYKIELDRRNSFYRLLNMTSGFELLLAEESGTFPLNADLQLNLEAVDDRIYATLNGRPLFGGIVTNAASGSGTIGLYCWNNAGATFDNVEVVPAPPNDPPAIDLIVPAPDMSFLAPADVLLSANASDADGILRVDFFAGQELIGSVAEPPYTLLWSNVPSGEYVLTALARDTRGFSTVSDSIAIHGLLIDQTFASGSFPGWTIRDEGNIQAPSSWQVSGGRLAQLSNIYGPGDVLTNRAGTFAVWDDATAYRWRDYLLNATLNSGDDDGIGVLFRYRDANNYYKLEFDTQRNFRKLLRKLNGLEITLASEGGGCPTNRAFDVQVKVVDGKIEARLDGALLFGGMISDGMLPLGTIALYCWGNPAARFDDVRVSALSPPDQPPVVTLLSPTNNATFMPPVNVMLFADAIDVDGSVQGVDFLQGETVLGTATARPYTFNWNNVMLGTYTLRASAVDNFGLRSFSEPVNVTVNYPTGYLVLRDAVVPAAGVLQFRIEAPLDTPVIIESSPDLQTWTPVATVTNVTTFSGTNAASETRQFYRARRQ